MFVNDFGLNRGFVGYPVFGNTLGYPGITQNTTQPYVNQFGQLTPMSQFGQFGQINPMNQLGQFGQMNPINTINPINQLGQFGQFGVPLSNPFINGCNYNVGTPWFFNGQVPYNTLNNVTPTGMNYGMNYNYGMVPSGHQVQNTIPGTFNTLGTLNTIR